jgi:hypothetical protein
MACAHALRKRATSTRPSLYGNLQMLPYPSDGYAVDIFTFYLRYKSDKNPAVNITHEDFD